LITSGVIQPQHLCLSPFLSRKARTIIHLPFSLVVVVAVDLVIIVAVVAVSVAVAVVVVVVVVVFPRICHTHPNTVIGLSFIFFTGRAFHSFYFHLEFYALFCLFCHCPY
jgi:hypothetical protein